MFKKESNRVLVAMASSVLSWLLAVLGIWACTGVLGLTLVWVGFIFNVAAIATLPFVADKVDEDATAAGIFFMLLVSLIYGFMVFHWWGLAYAVFTFVVFLVSSIIRNSR